MDMLTDSLSAYNFSFVLFGKPVYGNCR